MGRRRKAGSEWMPERVYLGKSAYEFKPYSGRTIRLCSLNASKRLVWQRFEEEKKILEAISGCFSELAREFFESKSFTDLAPRTRKDYASYSKKVLPVFGKMTANKIQPKHIRVYMDKRGVTSEVQANREHSFMSKVFSWGYERGKIDLNPCLKVRKFTETARDRYITDDEYNAVLEFASPLLRAFMEVSFCCAARQGDVLKITHQQLQENGIFIKQGKTGKAQIKGWTPRLRAAIELGKNYGIRNVTYVLTNENGATVPANILRNWYNSAKAKAAEAYPSLSFDFTFHDIKAKSISDYEKGNKQDFSGHKTKAQMEDYNRKTPVVDSHD